MLRAHRRDCVSDLAALYGSAGLARFATRLDAETRATIERGRRVREILKQPEAEPLAVADQLVTLRAATAGLFDELPVEGLARAERRIREAVREALPDISEQLDAGERLEESQWGRVLDVARAVITSVADD